MRSIYISPGGLLRSDVSLEEITEILKRKDLQKIKQADKPDKKSNDRKLTILMPDNKEKNLYSAKKIKLKDAETVYIIGFGYATHNLADKKLWFCHS